MRINVPRDEIISLMEKTAVLHPEHLYNVMEHHYEMMRIIDYIKLYQAQLYLLILWVKLLYALYANTYSYTVKYIYKDKNT